MEAREWRLEEFKKGFFLKIIQLRKIMPQISRWKHERRSLKEWRKTTFFAYILASCPMWHLIRPRCMTPRGRQNHSPYVPQHGSKAHGSMRFCLMSCFSRLIKWKKSRNPVQNLSIYRDPSKHFYSFRNFAVQGKGKHHGVARVYPTLLLSMFCIFFFFSFFCSH